MLCQKFLNCLHLLYLGLIIIRPLLLLLWQLQCLQIEQQLQNLNLKIWDPDLCRHLIQLPEDPLCSLHSPDEKRIFSGTVFRLKSGQINRKILYLFAQCRNRLTHIKCNRQPMIMTRREHKSACVCQPAIHLHVSRLHICICILRSKVLHPALPAVIDCKNISSRNIFRLKIGHMEIIKAEHCSRKYFIAGHGSLAGFIAELIHTASVALRQKQSLLYLLKCILHLFPSS